jgi:hypothetical protein
VISESDGDRKQDLGLEMGDMAEERNWKNRREVEIQLSL